MASVTFIQGNRGEMVVLDNFVFHKNVVQKAGVKWRCSERAKSKCPKYIVVLGDGVVVKDVHEHNHLPNVGDVQSRTLQSNMRKRAREESIPIQRIYEEEKVKLLDTEQAAETAANLPQYNGVRSNLYRERRKKFPMMPSTREEINLDGTWTQTGTGKRFLLGVDGENDDKVIAFASDRGLEHLAHADTFHVDGTFNSAPRIFYQIVTIHAFVLGIMMPLVFGLLPNKSSNTYIRFLTLVKEKAAAIGHIIQPMRVMMDFELGLVRAHEIVFPGVLVKGCYFHFTQCLYRKLQNIGLAVAYAENGEVREWFRRVLALPFIPVAQMEEAVTCVNNLAPNLPRVDEFTKYLCATWIKGQYPLIMWNYFKYDGPRTNNHIEGFNLRLKKKAGKPHPNIYEVVDLFKHEDASSTVSELQLDAGQKAPKRRKRYADIDTKIDGLGLSYMLNDRDMSSYLSAIGHIMERKQ